MIEGTKFATFKFTRPDKVSIKEGNLETKGTWHVENLRWMKIKVNNVEFDYQFNSQGTRAILMNPQKQPQPELKIQRDDDFT